MTVESAARIIRDRAGGERGEDASMCVVHVRHNSVHEDEKGEISASTHTSWKGILVAGL
jgi:hypothetical protein